MRGTRTLRGLSVFSKHERHLESQSSCNSCSPVVRETAGTCRKCVRKSCHPAITTRNCKDLPREETCNQESAAARALAYNKRSGLTEAELYVRVLRWIGFRVLAFGFTHPAFALPRFLTLREATELGHGPRLQLELEDLLIQSLQV